MGGCTRTLLLTLLVLGLANRHGAQAGDEDRKLTTGQRTVLAEGAAWGAITSLADGSLGLVYQRARQVSQFGAVNVAMEWIRSTDGGQTWSDPITLAERVGNGGALFDVRPDNGYIVYQQRNQALGQLPSGRIVVAMAELDYYYDGNGNEQQQNYLGSTFQYNGMVYTWSDDWGQTWTPTQPLPAGPFGGEHTYQPYIGASPHWRIVNLSDGTSMMSLYGSLDSDYAGPLEIPAGTSYMAGVTRSTDNGETWDDISLIMTKSGGLPYEETALSVLPDDKLLAHMRTPEGNVVQYTSADLGRNWQGPTPLTEPGQHPGGAFLLDSGIVMATWGNRREPYGAMAMASYNNGQTWDYEHRVSLAWDAASGSWGYANGAQAGDGSIVVTYYDMPPTGELSSQWAGGKVYAVRFDEQQFLQASLGGLPPPPPPQATLRWDGSIDPAAVLGFTVKGTHSFTANTDEVGPQPGVTLLDTLDLGIGGGSGTGSSYVSASVDLARSDGWFVEFRVKTLENNGDRFGNYLNVEDDMGGVAVLLNPTNLEFYKGNFASYPSSPELGGVQPITADFHTIRFEMAPNGTSADVLIDGVLAGSILANTTNVGGGPLLQFGDGSSGSNAMSIWDYVVVNREINVAGDLSDDGFVGQDDLNLVLANWGQTTPPGDPDADPSGDGFVGQVDLATVLGHWGQGTPPAVGSLLTAVPEPPALWLVAIAGAGLMPFCRRAMIMRRAILLSLLQPPVMRWPAVFNAVFGGMAGQNCNSYQPFMPLRGTLNDVNSSF